MNIFNKIFDKSKSRILPEKTFRHNTYSDEISQYSSLPRFYYIRGKKIDIDSPNSIAAIPLCETHFNINDEDWGIDTVLREHVLRHYSSIPEDLKKSCFHKISEFEEAGLKKESGKEKKAAEKRLKEQNEIEKKLKSITIEDMNQFHFFRYSMAQPFYDNQMSIMLINNRKNQVQIKEDIKQINDSVKKYCNTFNIVEDLSIDVESLKFDVTYSEKTGSKQYFTFFECTPYTPTGKLSKFPLILHYATKNHMKATFQQDYFGEIYYLQDGNIGKARLIYWIEHSMYLFSMGLKGKTLVVQKIEKSTEGNKEIIYKL